MSTPREKARRLNRRTHLLGHIDNQVGGVATQEAAGGGSGHARVAVALLQVKARLPNDVSLSLPALDPERVGQEPVRVVDSVSPRRCSSPRMVSAASFVRSTLPVNA